MNFFDHKDLGNHILQLCPKVVKHPVYTSFKERLPVDGHNRWPEHVADYADYISTYQFMSLLVISDKK